MGPSHLRTRYITESTRPSAPAHAVGEVFAGLAFFVDVFFAGFVAFFATFLATFFVAFFTAFFAGFFAAFAVFPFTAFLGAAFLAPPFLATFPMFIQTPLEP